MSDCGVGFASFLPNLSGAKSSGDLNLVVPPATSTLHDSFWRGLRAVVMKLKSARRARGGVPLDMRMFDC